ncbi:MAG: hypothetical protein IKR74_03905 [Bacilli bacterium]|nr:hypothetical protein [Bacilli bacterium]
MVKKIKEYKPSKWIYVIFFTLPLFFTLLVIRNLDNDLWYLLSEGRYIVQNGIYKIDPLSMHKGLHVTVQNWASASLFWIIYNLFKEPGMIVLVLICNFFICFFAYKLCLTISDDNKILSMLLMFATSITLSSHYIVTRPQILSFIILLALLYVLELYIKTDNGKYLIWIPIFSFIEINIHASLWWMIFLFILPYVIDSFKNNFLRTQGYRKKPLFIAIIVALLVGFINPYGYKAITFIFTSYGDKYMHSYINELLPFTFSSNNLANHMFLLILITSLIYVFFREGNIRVRYICLYCGTMILGLMSIKGFSHFVLVSTFPLAYFFKDLFPKSFNDIFPELRKALNIFYCIVGVLIIAGTSALFVYKIITVKLTHNAEVAIDVISQYADKNKHTIYSSFNDGGYVEFRGYKPYMDPRAELYLKKNNKKEDLFKEYYDLQHNILNREEFVDKYKFDFMLVGYSDALKATMQESTKYFVLYDDSEKQYMVFVRNDVFDAETRQQVIDSYSDALEKAKAEAKEKEVKNN